jgi:NADH dehydrogenase
VVKVLVAGGTGLVGSAITRGLIEGGHEVAVLSRSRASQHAVAGQAKWIKGDVMQPATLAAGLPGFEVVVDAVQFPNSPIENPKKGYTFERIDLGGTKNLIDAAVAANVGQYIGISGMGAAEDAQYHWQRFKWQEEQHLKASGLTYTVFRPTWIFAPDDVSLNRFLNFGKFLPFIPVIGDGKTHTNILYIGDLVAHVVAAVGNSAAYNRVFEIGGPEVLTMDEIIRTALRVSGKKRALIHQPKGLMKFIASIVQHAPGRPLTPDAIDFITMNGDADTSALRETFGLPLTPLAEGMATYLPRR